jgi:hypothetical protein
VRKGVSSIKYTRRSQTINEGWEERERREKEEKKKKKL